MTERKNIKPIRVMHQEGVSELEMRAAMDGTREMLALGDVEGLVEIVDLGVWRNNGYRNPDGSLAKHQSVDWYLYKGWQPHLKDRSKRSPGVGPDQVLTDLVIYLLSRSARKREDSYDLIVCQEDLNLSHYGYPYISGQGAKGKGAVCSTLRLRAEGLDTATHYECVKTLVMHELGHTFGAPNGYRKDLDSKSGKHCRNICIMRRGAPEPITHWVEKSHDRLRYGALCRDCHDDLVNYFGEKKCQRGNALSAGQPSR